MDYYEFLQYQNDAYNSCGTNHQQYPEAQGYYPHTQPPLLPTPSPPITENMYRGRGSWRQHHHIFPHSRDSRFRRRRSHLDDIYLPNYEDDFAVEDYAEHDDINANSRERNYHRKSSDWSHSSSRFSSSNFRDRRQCFKVVPRSANRSGSRVPSERQTPPQEKCKNGSNNAEGAINKSVENTKDTQSKASNPTSIDTTKGSVDPAQTVCNDKNKCDKEETKSSVSETKTDNDKSTKTVTDPSDTIIICDSPENNKEETYHETIDSPEGNTEDSATKVDVNANVECAAIQCHNTTEDKKTDIDATTSDDMTLNRGSCKTPELVESVPMAKSNLVVPSPNILLNLSPVPKPKNSSNAPQNESPLSLPTETPVRKNMLEEVKGVTDITELDADEETLCLEEFITIDNIDTTQTFLINDKNPLLDDYRVVDMEIGSPSPVKRKAGSSSDQTPTKKKKIDLYTDINSDDILNQIDDVLNEDNQKCETIKCKTRFRSKSLTLEKKPPEANIISKSKSEQMVSQLPLEFNFDLKENLLILLADYSQAKFNASDSVESLLNTYKSIKKEVSVQQKPAEDIKPESSENSTTKITDEKTDVEKETPSGKPTDPKIKIISDYVLKTTVNVTTTSVTSLKPNEETDKDRNNTNSCISHEKEITESESRKRPADLSLGAQAKKQIKRTVSIDKTEFKHRPTTVIECRTQTDITVKFPPPKIDLDVATDENYRIRRMSHPKTNELLMKKMDKLFGSDHDIDPKPKSVFHESNRDKPSEKRRNSVPVSEIQKNKSEGPSKSNTGGHQSDVVRKIEKGRRTSVPASLTGCSTADPENKVKRSTPRDVNTKTSNDSKDKKDSYNYKKDDGKSKQSTELKQLINRVTNQINKSGKAEKCDKVNIPKSTPKTSKETNANSDNVTTMNNTSEKLVPDDSKKPKYNKVSSTSKNGMTNTAKKGNDSNVTKVKDTSLETIPLPSGSARKVGYNNVIKVQNTRLESTTLSSGTTRKVNDTTATKVKDTSLDTIPLPNDTARKRIDNNVTKVKDASLANIPLPSSTARKGNESSVTKVKDTNLENIPLPSGTTRKGSDPMRKSNNGKKEEYRKTISTKSHKPTTESSIKGDTNSPSKGKGEVSDKEKDVSKAKSVSAMDVRRSDSIKKAGNIAQENAGTVCKGTSSSQAIPLDKDGKNTVEPASSSKPIIKMNFALISEENFVKCSVLYQERFPFRQKARYSFVENDCCDRAVTLDGAEIIENVIVVKETLNVTDSEDVIEVLTDTPIIDLTEDDVEVKEEDDKNILNKTIDLSLSERNVTAEGITLYRSEETQNNRLEVQAMVASISPAALKSNDVDIKINETGVGERPNENSPPQTTPVESGITPIVVAQNNRDVDNVCKQSGSPISGSRPTVESFTSTATTQIVWQNTTCSLVENAINEAIKQRAVQLAASDSSKSNTSSTVTALRTFRPNATVVQTTPPPPTTSILVPPEVSITIGSEPPQVIPSTSSGVSHGTFANPSPPYHTLTAMLNAPIYDETQRELIQTQSSPNVEHHTLMVVPHSPRRNEDSSNSNLLTSNLRRHQNNIEDIRSYRGNQTPRRIEDANIPLGLVQSPRRTEFSSSPRALESTRSESVTQSPVRGENVTHGPGDMRVAPRVIENVPQDMPPLRAPDATTQEITRAGTIIIRFLGLFDSMRKSQVAYIEQMKKSAQFIYAIAQNEIKRFEDESSKRFYELSKAMLTDLRRLNLSAAAENEQVAQYFVTAVFNSLKRAIPGITPSWVYLMLEALMQPEMGHYMCVPFLRGLYNFVSMVTTRIHQTAAGPPSGCVDNNAARDVFSPEQRNLLERQIRQYMDICLRQRTLLLTEQAAQNNVSHPNLDMPRYQNPSSIRPQQSLEPNRSNLQDNSNVPRKQSKSRKPRKKKDSFKIHLPFSRPYDAPPTPSVTTTTSAISHQNVLRSPAAHRIMQNSSTLMSPMRSPNVSLSTSVAQVNSSTASEPVYAPIIPTYRPFPNNYPNMAEQPSGSSPVRPPTTCGISALPTNTAVFTPPTNGAVLAPPTTSALFAPPTTSALFAPPTNSSAFAPPTNSAMFAPSTNDALFPPSTNRSVVTPPTNGAICTPPTNRATSTPISTSCTRSAFSTPPPDSAFCTPSTSSTFSTPPPVSAEESKDEQVVPPSPQEVKANPDLIVVKDEVKWGDVEKKFVIIDLTWMDDIDPEQLQNEIQCIAIKKEEPAEEEEPEYEPDDQMEDDLQDPNLVTPSPADSGIASPPAQMEYDEQVFVDRTCICGQPALYVCNCIMAMYCSEPCQARDWRTHRELCHKHNVKSNKDDIQNQEEEDKDT